jgi:2-dehydropantoate 2-reductase
MKIAIIGTGGVGGYFGGKLALAGNDVTFLARGAHLQAIQSNGLQVKSTLGNFVVVPAKVTDHIKDMGKPDLVFLSVKAWQVRDLAGDIKSILGSHTCVLPLQNGVMAAEELALVIDKKHIIGGLCRIFSMIEAPGVINHFGIDPVIVFGEMDHVNTERTIMLKKLFDDAGITSKITDDIQTELWKKFILICVGGILAITRLNYGEISEYPQLKEMIRNLLTEIYDVSVKAGAHVESDFVQKSMMYIDTYPKESTTSMARDIWAGKPSELDYQNGTVVRLGERYGVETPVNKFLYNCLLPFEAKARNK